MDSLRHRLRKEVQGGQLQRVQRLLERFGPDKCGLAFLDVCLNETVVHIATRFGHFEVLKWLLKNHGRFFGLLQKDKLGLTILLRAVASGHLDIVEWLLSEFGPEKCGLDLLTKTSENVVHLASVYGKLDVLKWLLANYGQYFDILQKDMWGTTALMGAILVGNLDVVKWLLSEFGPEKCGLNLVETNKAIHFAALVGHGNLFRWLLDHYGSMVDLEQNHENPTISAVYGNQQQWLLENYRAAKCGYQIKSHADGVRVEKLYAAKRLKNALLL